MKRFAYIAAILTALSAAPALTGCELILGETKTSKGQLYQSGDPRFDPYFDQVHNEQVKSASWEDDAKQSRKPIVGALNLKPDATNGTILTATKELKTGSAALGAPVEQTTATETDRAKHMTAEAKRLEDLRAQGEQLRKQASDDKANMGAAKADDKAVAKKDEIKRELGACDSALNSMIHDARKASREAEELADKLTAAWTGRPEDEKHIDVDSAVAAKKPDPPPPSSAAAAPPPKKPGKSKPAATVAATAGAPAPPPPPPPPANTAKGPDEVFNP